MRFKYHPSVSNSFSADVLLWVVVWIAAMVLYALTCQQGAGWQDSGMFQWRVLMADYRGHLGLALAHPFYILLGRCWLWFWQVPDCTAVNLFSAVGMACALANLALAAAWLVHSRLAGVCAALLVGCSHTAWWLSTIAEVYTWNAALLGLELLLFVKLMRAASTRVLMLLFFVSGLNFGIHNMALISLPVYAGAALWMVARRQLKPWSLAGAGAVFCLGATPVLWLMARELAGGAALSAVVRSMLIGTQVSGLIAQLKAGRLAVNAALFGLNGWGLLLPLAVFGCARLNRRIERPWKYFLALLVVLHGGFLCLYWVPDQFTFGLPTLVLCGLAAAGGIASLSPRRQWVLVGVCVLSCIAQAGLYGLMPQVFERGGLQPARMVARPGRNELRYWITPWKHNEKSAEQFAAQALAGVPQGSVILSDGTARYPLLLVLRRRNDIPVSLIRSTGALHRYAQEPTYWDRLAREGRLFAVSCRVVEFPGELAGRVRCASAASGALQRIWWESAAN